jgi:hypothetical protein
LLAFFLACFKFTSDIFLVSASHRIVSTQLYDCYQVKRSLAKIWLMLGELLVIILVISSLYYLGSLLSNEVLWLEVANDNIVRDIVSRRNLFQLAFFVIQFILTFGTLVVAGLLWSFRRMELVVSNPSTSSKNEQSSETDLLYQDDKAAYFTIGATLVLWMRSFSELVVSTKYHPVPNGTSAAREAIYGLCTVAFLYLIKSTDKDLTVSTDPLQEQIEENTRRYILQAVERDVTAGRRAPVLRTVLGTIRNNPDIALSAETRQEIQSLSREEKKRVTRVHQTILISLVQQYGDLGEPEAKHG